jgi:hypothetical protein
MCGTSSHHLLAVGHFHDISPHVYCISGTSYEINKGALNLTTSPPMAAARCRAYAAVTFRDAQICHKGVPNESAAPAERGADLPEVGAPRPACGRRGARGVPRGQPALLGGRAARPHDSGA